MRMPYPAVYNPGNHEFCFWTTSLLRRELCSRLARSNSFFQWSTYSLICTKSFLAFSKLSDNFLNDLDMALLFFSASSVSSRSALIITNVYLFDRKQAQSIPSRSNYLLLLQINSDMFHSSLHTHQTY